jgi:enoyl-CoA hydratase
MTSTLVLSDDAGPVRVLTMNRPAARNALSPALIAELYDALRDADDDPSVRAVILTGTDARVGILPGGGMTARLPQLIGAAMARRLSMTGEVIDAALAERIGLVTEVVGHERLLTRAVELAGQIAEVPAPIMAGLKEIYVSGAAAVTGSALAAEQAIAGAQTLDRDGLKGRYAEITERNRRQIRPQL